MRHPQEIDGNDVSRSESYAGLTLQLRSGWTPQLATFAWPERRDRWPDQGPNRRSNHWPLSYHFGKSNVRNC